MRWVDMFAIGTFLATGRRVPESGPAHDGPADTTPESRPTARDEAELDEWDAETLDEIPEELEIDQAPGIDGGSLVPVPALLLRRGRLVPTRSLP